MGDGDRGSDDQAADECERREQQRRHAQPDEQATAERDGSQQHPRRHEWRDQQVGEWRNEGKGSEMEQDQGQGRRLRCAGNGQ
jgi:hypothetical protein